MTATATVEFNPIRDKTYRNARLGPDVAAFLAWFELHHVGDEEKVDHKVWSWTNDRREAELAKCVVLCRDCHEDDHWPHSMPRSPILFAAVRAREREELEATQRRLHRRLKRA